jgi:hypothetical protein
VNICLMFETERLGQSICRSVLRQREVRATIVVVGLHKRKTNRLTILKIPRTRGFHAGPMRERQQSYAVSYAPCSYIRFLNPDSFGTGRSSPRFGASRQLAPSGIQPQFIVRQDHLLPLLFTTSFPSPMTSVSSYRIPRYITRNNR